MTARSETMTLARYQDKAKRRADNMEIVKAIVTNPITLGLGAMLVNRGLFQVGFYKPKYTSGSMGWTVDRHWGFTAQGLDLGVPTYMQAPIGEIEIRKYESIDTIIALAMVAEAGSGAISGLGGLVSGLGRLIK